MLSGTILDCENNRVYPKKTVHRDNKNSKLKASAKTKSKNLPTVSWLIIPFLYYCNALIKCSCLKCLMFAVCWVYCKINTSFVDLWKWKQEILPPMTIYDWMYASMYVHIYLCHAYIKMCIHTCKYICKYVFVCMQQCIYLFMHTCMYTNQP